MNWTADNIGRISRRTGLSVAEIRALLRRWRKAAGA